MQNDTDIRFCEASESGDGPVGETGTVPESHQLPVALFKLGQEEGQAVKVGLPLCQLLRSFIGRQRAGTLIGYFRAALAIVINATWRAMV